ncbi:DUF2059 domain-containing protein [Undibacterium baiyunense]|uniref:DUF2059 domain-containing protein n=1 Tax=Undibacterium baiyunense TaxID=2828731 RepID=A0A941DIA5_9BURK|nr:DUF2059 domain-containing protein [Undibacterium baiyunense]MBR7746742.1 DUF2059 domain-containing protein [Undibacterium baiyunense]
MKFNCLIVALFFSCASFSSAAVAQDSPELRAKAADRYLKSVPMSAMLEDAYTSLAQQMPADQREKFLKDIRSIVRIEFLESISKEKMVKVFTADELNAIASFYESKEGASAMKKFGVYMGEIMPAIQKEMMQAMGKLREGKK